ncbi:MAG: right-handed parallel beta-helix repeat-containing protein [Bacteroidales bacterium]
MKKVFLLASFACIGLQLTAQKNYYVTPAGSGDGSSWASAATLQKAIEKVADGDLIHLSAGTFVPQVVNPDTCTDMRMKSYAITKNIKLIGGYPATPSAGATADPTTNKTIISGDLGNGDNAYHLILVATPQTEGKKVEISGITFTGGVADGTPTAVIPLGGEESKGFMCTKGAAVVASGANLDLTDCSFVDNYAQREGGAVFYYGSNGLIKNCNFENNETAQYGVLHLYGGNVDVENCSFASNIANRAGAIAVRGGVTSSIINSSFSKNKATSTANFSGGAIFTEQGSDLIIDNCDFTENEGMLGGAIAVNGKRTDSASPFSKVLVSKSTIEKSTIDIEFKYKGEDGKDKIRSYVGGAFYVEAGDDFGSLVKVEDCIIQDNCAREGGVALIKKKANVEFHRCIITRNNASCQYVGLNFDGPGTVGKLVDCQISDNRFFQAKEYNMMTVFAGNCASLDIYNCLIKDNKEIEAAKSGVVFGARWGGQLNVANSTITGNSGKNLIYADGDKTIDGVKYRSQIDMVSCTFIDNPDCPVATFTVDQSAIFNAYNTIFASNLIKGNEGGLKGVTFNKCIHGKKILDSNGTQVPDLEFDRVMMIEPELTDQGGFNPVFVLYPDEVEEDMPDYAITHGMNMSELVALSANTGISEDILKTDQRGAVRNARYMGAYTEGVASGTDEVFDGEDVRVYNDKNGIVIESGKPALVSIFTINGIRVIEKQISAGIHPFEITGTGVYIVKIGDKTHKVIL